MEKRKIAPLKPGQVEVPVKMTALPEDYRKMVADIFAKNFSKGLKALAEMRPNPHFFISGGIYADELILSVSIVYAKELSATTIYASCDFDPKASAPKADELLGHLVDGAGSFFHQFLDEKKPKRLEQLAGIQLATFEEGVPFDWTKMQVNKRDVYLKVDRSNPTLDQAADEWLEKHEGKKKPTDFH